MPPDPLAGALPVAFDDAAADRAVDALHRLGRALLALRLDGADAAATAARDWHGASRRWFDDRWDALAKDLRRSGAAAFEAADAIRAAKVRAAAVQEERNLEALRSSSLGVPAPVPPGRP